MDEGDEGEDGVVRMEVMKLRVVVVMVEEVEAMVMEVTLEAAWGWKMQVEPPSAPPPYLCLAG